MTDHPTPKKPEPDSTVKGALKAKIDSGLLRSSGVVSFFTMLSRVMGLIRDIVLARVIGAEALADVFFVAFKIPTSFRVPLLKVLLLRRLCLCWENIARRARRLRLKN